MRYVTSVVDVNSSEGRRRLREKRGGMCLLPQLVFSERCQDMFWHLLPAN